MRLSILTDRQLVVLFQKGQTKAFEELLSRYRQRVFARIRIYVKDYAMAEDIFQDTFVKAINALREGQYQEDGRFAAWILRIATNLSIDNYRGWKKMPKVRGRDDYDPFDYIMSGHKNFVDSACDNEALGEVKKLLNFLPKEQKEIVMMRMYYDMSFKEIAEMQNISINTALGRMRYGLINMRKLLEKHNLELSLS
ncbi:MAG: RNA polymerase sigma factor [Flavobacteriales bacterium]|nr:RNA polymerase sigma factor [Flavobacteriales bacterium]